MLKHFYILLALYLEYGILQIIMELLKLGELLKHFETKLLTKTCDVMDVSLTVSLIKNEKGQIFGLKNDPELTTSGATKLITDKILNYVKILNPMNKINSVFITKLFAKILSTFVPTKIIKISKNGTKSGVITETDKFRF